MSDIFFIIASVCIIILTILLSILILKLIDSIDDVNLIMSDTRHITSNVSRGLTTVLSFGAVASPVLGIVSKIFRKKRR